MLDSIEGADDYLQSIFEVINEVARSLIVSERCRGKMDEL